MGQGLAGVTSMVNGKYHKFGFGVFSVLNGNFSQIYGVYAELEDCLTDVCSFVFTCLFCTPDLVPPEPSCKAFTVRSVECPVTLFYKVLRGGRGRNQTGKGPGFEIVAQALHGWLTMTWLVFDHGMAMVLVLLSYR